MDEDSQKKSPTLYDILLQSAFIFYNQNQFDLPHPPKQFIIDKPEYFADIQTFVSIQPKTNDSLSDGYRVIKIMQDWLRFHQQDHNLNALAQADLFRLDFIYKNIVLDNKDDLYLKALQDFVKTYARLDIAAMANYKIANLLYRKGLKYTPKKGKKHQLAINQAKQLCEQTIQKYPDTKGAEYCKNLLAQILQKKLDVQIEKNIPEQKNGLIKISYKNIKDIHFRVYKVSFDDWFRIEHHYGKDINVKNLIFKNHLVDEWTETLPQTGDNQSHEIETKLSPLDNALYVLYADIPGDSSIFGYTLFQVSNIALQEASGYSNDKISAKQNTYFVYDRNNGDAIKNANIQVKIYPQETDWHPYRNIKTDNDGKFVIDIPKEVVDRNISFIIHYAPHKTAYFFTYRSSYNGRYFDDDDDEEEDYNEKAFLFTDRAIYRPGQKVYFKGIALVQKKNKSVVLPNEKVEVTLVDANYQDIKTLKLITNEYGSFTGSFQLPSQTQIGEFTIEVYSDDDSKYDIDDEITIKVEAYKRPKFEVKFKPVKKSYKVNEMVSAKGIAKSFAGTNITNAKVSYHVKRKVEMPRWWYWYHPYSYGLSSQEISHGTTTTNDQGEFEIKFKALPDLKVNKKDLPVFSYEVLAEVTDINGETRTATSIVRVGYHGLIANLDINPTIDKNVGDSIRISTKNLNGVKLPSKGKIKIYALQDPGRILVERPWKSPDIQHYDKQTFVKLFPHIPYDDKENDYHYWQKKLVFTTSYNTEISDKVALKNLDNWKTGKYIAIVETHDKDGQLITGKTLFELTDAKSNLVPNNTFFSINADKRYYQPNEQLKLKIGSAGEGLHARILVEKAGKIIDDRMVDLNKTFKTITIPFHKKDNGYYVIHYSFMAYNSSKNGRIRVGVFPSTELMIGTETFRNKLLPGQQETWLFKIKGPKAQKVSAEVLASMYDASLDEFSKNRWHFTPIDYNRYYYYGDISLDNEDSFKTESIYFHSLDSDLYYKVENGTFGHFNWFRFQFGSQLSNPIQYDCVTINALGGKVSGVRIRGAGSPGASASVILRGEKSDSSKKKLFIIDGVVSEKLNISPDDIRLIRVLKGDTATALYGSKAANGVVIISTKSAKEKKLNVEARKNLNETAFFFPQLHTDKEGNVSFSFTVPEALTKWKLQLLAHDKKLNNGYLELFAQTQKDLMVFPNAPRFVREGDRLIFSTKISNLTAHNLNGTAELELINAQNGKDISRQIIKNKIQQSFTLAANSNTQVRWELQIPADIQAIQYKVMALSGKQSDAEQNVLPVLSNRILVTETMPMWVRGNQSKTFTLDKLLHNQSSSLKNHRLSLEITGNPAWYAVQSLPYLMEYPYECSE